MDLHNFNGNLIYNVNIPNQQSSSIRFKVHFEMRDASLTLVAVNPAGTTRQSTILRVQIPRWAIALIVILSVSFAAATVLFFLRKRGLLSNQTWMKFNKLIEIKQTIGESEEDREEQRAQIESHDQTKQPLSEKKEQH